jgi:trehalose 6-phosphate phosphatase
MSRSTRQNLPKPRADLGFFLDVDGTLLPIAETPGAVSPSAVVSTVLIKLAAVCGGAVALISGRSLTELDRLFPERRFPAAGQHGSEWRDAQGKVMRIQPRAPAFNLVRQLMRREADADSRLLLEDKGLSLALHYRRAPECGPALTARLRVALEVCPEFSLQPGKLVLEVRAAGVSKAHAVRAFMNGPPFSGRIPAFVGDDATDEDGFAMVNRHGGVSIKVGVGNSIAHYRLSDTDAVLQWLTACSRLASEQAEISNAQS